MNKKSASWAALAATCGLGCLLWLSCAESTTQNEPRAPHSDYGREPPRTSDGRIVGADEVPPGDKLQQGPRAGSDGLHPAPGWTADKNGLRRHREVHSGPLRLGTRDAGTR